MKKQIGFLVCAAMVASISNNSFAGKVSEMQLLNSQIQSQLQQMQETQQKQTNDMNAKIQAQMKQMQKELQSQIETVNTQNQDKMKKMLVELQAQIKQVQDSIPKPQ